MKWFDISFTGGTRPHYEQIAFILDDDVITYRGREVKTFQDFIWMYNDSEEMYEYSDETVDYESFFRIPWQETTAYCKHGKTAKGVVLFFDSEKKWQRMNTGFYVYILLEDGEKLPELAKLDRELYLATPS